MRQDEQNLFETLLDGPLVSGTNHFLQARNWKTRCSR